MLTMRQAVSIVHYITDNVYDSSFVFIQLEKFDFNFLLRCIKQVSRFSECLRVTIVRRFCPMDLPVTCKTVATI